MICLVGNKRQAEQAKMLLPPPVAEELLYTMGVLDDAYGMQRNYATSGGYAIIADDVQDVQMLLNLLDVHIRLAEYSKLISNFIVSLYLLNDDYSVILFMPQGVAQILEQKERIL